MQDLVVAAVALMVLSSAALLAGRRVAVRWSSRDTFVLGAVVLTALLVFVSRFYGTWQMARLLPFSGVIILGNWIPVGGAFLAGITLGQSNSPRWRSGFLAGLVLLVSVYSVLCCLQGHLPTGPGYRQSADSSEQSRRSSCGPCCAAELLRNHGIGATEEELLSLCLTSYRGSPALGLYRGLKLKTAGTKWDVQVVSCTFDELLRTPPPLLLRISLPPVTSWDGRGPWKLEKRTGKHAVLLMAVDDQKHLTIFDPAMPSYFHKAWRTEDLREQWLGEALRLVPRDGKQPEGGTLNQS